MHSWVASGGAARTRAHPWAPRCWPWILPWRPSAGPHAWPAQETLQELPACPAGTTVSLVSGLGCPLQQLAWATQHHGGTVLCLQLSWATSQPAIEGEGREGKWESCCCLTYQYSLRSSQCASKHLCCSCPTRYLHRLVFQNSFAEIPLHI